MFFFQKFAARHWETKFHRYILWEKDLLVSFPRPLRMFPNSKEWVARARDRERKRRWRKSKNENNFSTFRSVKHLASVRTIKVGSAGKGFPIYKKTQKVVSQDPRSYPRMMVLSPKTHKNAHRLLINAALASRRIFFFRFFEKSREG